MLIKPFCKTTNGHKWVSYLMGKGCSQFAKGKQFLCMDKPCLHVLHLCIYIFQINYTLIVLNGCGKLKCNYIEKPLLFMGNSLFPFIFKIKNPMKPIVFYWIADYGLISIHSFINNPLPRFFGRHSLGCKYRLPISDSKARQTLILFIFRFAPLFSPCCYS